MFRRFQIKAARFKPGSALLVSLCLAVSVVTFSCGSKPMDVRSVMPADSLIYLETNDLGKTLAAITENPKFKELAKNKPDLSALKGISLAVAVTGFETSEQQVSEENSVLNFQPHFVAVAETNAWSWQTASFTENQLGELINEMYGGEVDLTVTPEKEGKHYVWTAQDGRKAFALVQGSAIYFGNDESSIEKCMAVKRGEAESVLKNPRITPAADKLAFGYIAPDGIAQLSNLIGISLAIKAGEEGDVKSFIARVLPEVLRNTVKEVTWSASRQETGQMEDRYTISLTPETAKIFNETLIPSSDTEPDSGPFFPPEVVSTTRYNFRNPQIAWRSVVLTAQNKTDQLSGKLISAFSDSLFEPYAIEDPELFLSSVGNALQTATFDADGEIHVVVARVKDLEKVKRSIAKEVNFIRPPEKAGNADLWRSDDGELAAAFIEGYIVLGDSESVAKCVRVHDTGQNPSAPPLKVRLGGSNAAIATAGTQSDPSSKLITFLAERRSEGVPLSQDYFTETRFNQNGIERTTVSDFGLIGSVIEQLSTDK
jgi:hypothetical protein